MSVFRKIKKIIRIEWILLKTNFKVFFEYRINAFVGELGSLFYNLGAILFIEILFLRLDAIAGWDKWDLILIYAVSQFITYFYFFCSHRNFVRFSRLVNRGDFDLLLIKPYNSMIYSTLRLFSPQSLLNILFSSGIAYYAFQNKSYQVTLLSSVGFLISVFISVLIVHLLNVIIVTPTFKFFKNDFHRLYQKTSDLNQYPYEIFSSPIEKLIFLFIFPLGVIANVPFRILTKQVLIQDIFLQIFILIFFFMVTKFVWKKGMQVYSSASS